jgi:hypothetical protein
MQAETEPDLEQVNPEESAAEDRAVVPEAAQPPAAVAAESEPNAGPVADESDTIEDSRADAQAKGPEERGEEGRES